MRTAFGIALATALWAASVADAATPATKSLTVTVTGAQTGTVTADGGQISCPGTCTGSYPQVCANPGCTEYKNRRVTLNSTVPSGFALSWSRACDEGGKTANPCTVEASGVPITAHYDDVSPPSVALTAPAAGPAGGGVVLSASASDAQSEIAGVEFFVDGNPVGNDTTAPYAVGFDTKILKDGPATVAARATNRDDDTADSSVAITVDNTAPGLTVTGPDAQTYGPGSTQSWSYSASDANGAPTVRCSVTPATAAPSYAACAGAGTHSVSGLGGGSYTLHVRATDSAGNLVERTRSFAIDATAPGTSIVGGPADGVSSAATRVTFTFSADEAGSTFRCRVHPAALTPGAFGPCSGAGTHTASGFAPGTYAFDVVAVDKYGNTDLTPATRTFTVTGSGGGTSGTAGTGGVVAGQRIDARVQTFFSRFGHRTRVDKLTVLGAPEGARVTITCKAKRKGCTFKRVVVRFKGGPLKLAKRLKHRKLRAGAVITIAVSKPGLVSKTFRYTLRATKFPSVKIV